MPFATLTDLLESDPTITEYGEIDFTAELARAEAEVIRIIRVRWWPTFASRTRLNDITLTLTGPIMDSTKLDPTQWTRATVYYCLAHYICPKLSKFEEVPDRFRNQMDYYSTRFETEFDICVREGVRYQLDDNAAFSDAERTPDTDLRLRR